MMMKQTNLWPAISLSLLLFSLFLLAHFTSERNQLQTALLMERVKDESWCRKNETPEELRFSRKILSNDEKLIFVGGVPRSGTTLMRAMLDAHSDIRCGEETFVLVELLGKRQEWTRRFRWPKFNSTVINGNMFDKSITAAILEIISSNGPMAPRLCNKDPFTALHVSYLRTVFPNSKFILMIRDGRAVVHSMITRKVPVVGFDHKHPEKMIKAWNRNIMIMNMMCSETPGTCLKVWYERLVQDPESESRRILSFLDVEWSFEVLRHHEHIGGEVHLNPSGWSSSQVQKEINIAALSSWHNFFPSTLLTNISRIAPMLKYLGYDPSNNIQNYSHFTDEDFYQRVPH